MSKADYDGPERRLSGQRRHRLTARLLPLVAIAAAAAVAGLLVGARHEPRERVVAERFLRAWERADYGGMYALLSSESRTEYTVGGFRSLYRRAAETATLERVRTTGPLRQDDGDYEVPMVAETRRYGDLKGTLRFSVVSGADDLSGVVFARRLIFPGLRDGEELSRTVEMPPRADLQSRDGSVLATGPDRTSEEVLAPEVVGSVGPIPEDEAKRFAKLGYPEDATVGLSGLERQFETRLAGTLGGTLSAGSRTLADVDPRQGGAVRTSIDLDLEAAAVTALAGRLGGIAVMRPRTGEVLALAGLGYSAPQPPGSTFKIITLAGALEARTVKPDESFPVETAAVLSGVTLENANGEACGGTLEETFAESCNSVFAPMGAELGAEKLVATAERFGFNEASDIVGAPPSSIPPASELGDELGVGSTAIGQGRVTSTPLRMAEVTAAIANGGLRVRPVFLRGAQGRSSRAVSAATAKVMTRFMRAVVKEGTGVGAAVSGVKVAGKTGTAELRTTVDDPATPENEADEADATDTTAWFVAFAPARRPQVAVAVMLVGQGAGGATAAPAAKTVLEAALDR